MHSESQHEPSWLLDPVRCLRVDRTGLWAQFPASGSGRETLCKLQMQRIDTDIVGRLSLYIARCNRRIIRGIILAGLLGSFLFAREAPAADELVPPFGFRWNDS